MPEIENLPQYGDRKKLDTLEPSVPEPDPQISDDADGVPVMPLVNGTPPPGAAGDFPFPQDAAMLNQLPTKEEFLSPYAQSGSSYEEDIALFVQGRMMRMATDEMSDPRMKELYWASAQDLEELKQNKEQNSDAGQPSQSQQGTDNKKEEKPSNNEMVGLLKDIKDLLSKNGNKQ